MTDLNFRGNLDRVVWFSDSPDTGLPECVCSYCGKPILDKYAIPLRMWSKKNLEVRFCDPCAKECFGLEMSPDPSIETIFDEDKQ